MRITSVTYRQLKSFGNYSHEAVEATAAVLADTDPSEVLAELRLWVDAQIGDSERGSALRERAWKLESEVARFEGRLERAKTKWEQAKALLERHGVDLTAELDDVPF